MRSNSIPVYDIENFKFRGTEKDFYSNEIKKHLSQHKDFITNPHKHSFYLCIFITKGHGVHEIDFNSYKVKTGSLFLMHPGQTHTWNISEDTEGYVFFHTKEFYNFHFAEGMVEDFPFYSCSNNIPLISIGSNDMENLETVFKAINAEYSHDGLMKCQRICSLLNVLYIDLLRLYIPDKARVLVDKNYMAKMRKFIGLIEKYYKVEKRAGAYAEMMNISEKHLNRICKTTLNMTTTEVITKRVILEAKRMLVYSKFSISQIAEDLGYPENAYFFRLFKKWSGKTPSEFLKSQRVN